MIRLENVRKTFRGVRVLDGLSFELALGERIALIGSNGAGKTTLIRCLLGEYVHDGEVRIGGADPRRDRAAVLAGIGFVPQLPPPLRMPAGQLIDFAAGLCGKAPARIDDIARQLGLDVDAIRTRQFVRLSGGMKQKLLIAIALGRDAKLLIMDEPAANLDPEARRIFFDLLAERAQAATMIISSHRLDEVSALVNRVIEMDTGRIVLDDKVAEPGALSSRLDCRIRLKHPDPAIAKALAGWKFAFDAGEAAWSGEIAGADRLRFLGVVSRYTGLVSSLDMTERTH
ncbi:ABC transporter ATP-binding protein [Thauera sp. Sel9]|uniref:ABC transporter ATP-binding protein n=1 Tax=Thauera sp. Sel9 TaxID=2974299 RepID=UPI0021E14F9D|nr:ABC transporter ATP-binding protein [Thauera sp. Sel9]MCV2218951.1 ABC transporter ATP-binding protein [Thauera sp. Sel9]